MSGFGRVGARTIWSGHIAEEIGKAADRWRELGAWPLSDLQRAIDACEDAKSLIGLLELRHLRLA